MTNPRSLFTIQSLTNASLYSHFTLKKPSKLFSYKKLTFCYFKVLCSSQPLKTPHNSNLTSTLVAILRVIPDWADKIQKEGIRKKRSLYNHETWVQYRSSLRHLRHLFSSYNSRVILSLIPSVVAFTSFAFLITSYNSAVSLHWLPELFPLLRASPQPYQLTAPALALLLVFRIEASYARFEIGKKA